MLFQAETLTVEKDTDGSAFLKIDVPGRGVNVITRQVLRDLTEALDRLEREKTLPILVLRSGKNTGFLAGADLREFLELRDEAAARELSRQGQELFNRLARLPFPTLAAVSGACLGGGLELALACDYRLVLDRPGTQLGLPEVELGLLPGWGGTQRLPRVCGIEHALTMILTGKRLSAVEAYRWGLADALARTEQELRAQFMALQKRAVTQGKRQLQRPERRSWRQWFLETTSVGKKVLFRAGERSLQRRVAEDMPAPQEAFAAVAVGALEGLDAGLQRESEGAGRLVGSLACRRLIGLFLAREAARKLPAELARADNQSVQRIGVVGLGERGAALAQLAAIKGAQVVVQETNAEALGAGLLRIQQLFQKAIHRGIVSQAEALARLASIQGGSDWKGFDAVPVVLLANDDALECQQTTLRELETRTRADCVLAVTSPCFSVEEIAAGVSRPERVAGFHIVPPIHKVPLAEIVGTGQTSLAARARLTKWALDLGKTPLAVRDSLGQIVMRVAVPYLLEAVQLVAEGLPIAVVDEEMRRFGMTTGPLELLDTLGLQSTTTLAQRLRPFLGDRLPPTDPVERMLANGWLGGTAGMGFYDHSGKKPSPNRLAENLLRQGRATGPLAGLSLEARRADARDRLVFRTVDEAARCVSEQLTNRPEDLDLALVLGIGWAPHRGGPLHHADDLGLGDVVRRLRALTQRHGLRFTPADGLVQTAEGKQRYPSIDRQVDPTETDSD